MFSQWRVPASGMASKEQTGHTSEGSRGHMGQRSFTRVDTRARASHPQTQKPTPIRNPHRSETGTPLSQTGISALVPAGSVGGSPPVALTMVSLLTAPILAFWGLGGAGPERPQIPH